MPAWLGSSSGGYNHSYGEVHNSSGLNKSKDISEVLAGSVKRRMDDSIALHLNKGLCYYKINRNTFSRYLCYVGFANNVYK